MCLIKRVDWETPVPELAPLFVATAGSSAASLKMFWAGWLEDDRLRALSLFQEKPIELPLSPGDAVIGPPVVAPDRRMALPFFGPHGDRPGLSRLLVSGEPDAPPRVETEALSELRGEPSLAALTPIAGVPATTALAWVEASGDGRSVEAALVGEKGVERLSVAIPREVVPFEAGRPGLRAWFSAVTRPPFTPEAAPRRVSMAFLATDPSARRTSLVEATFDFDRSDGQLNARDLELAADQTAWASVAYLRGPEPKMPRVLAVTHRGEAIAWADPSAPASSLGSRPDLLGRLGRADPIVCGARALYEVDLESGPFLELRRLF